MFGFAYHYGDWLSMMYTVMVTNNGYGGFY